MIKNRYVGRTFIEPDQELRRQGIRLKFNPLAEIAGPADRDRRRLDRPRQHDARARPDAVRRRCGRGARPDLVAARRLAVLLRDRHGRRGRARGRPPLGRGDARAHRRDRASTTCRSTACSGRRGLAEDAVCRACFTRDYPTRVPDGPARREAPLRAAGARRACNGVPAGGLRLWPAGGNFGRSSEA